MRDKVKRFISILMTALMLVNLLPVGALADGVKISNSVQNRWPWEPKPTPKPAANVYVYVKATGDPELIANLTINSSGWFTIGMSANVPGMGNPSEYAIRSYSFGDVGVSHQTVLSTNFTRWKYNQEINTDDITWTEFYIDNGADDYVKAGTLTWHMNGKIDIRKVPSVYTIQYVDYDTKKVIRSYDEPGYMGQKPYKNITAPASWQDDEYSYSFLPVDGHPQTQTVTFEKQTDTLTFYYKKNTAAYTVNYYLNGTTTKVADSKNDTAPLGETVTKSPITVDGYTPVSNDKKSITIGTGTNEINFYYYENVTLTANSDTKTYDGTQKSVSGFTGAPVDADFRNITVGASGTDVGTYDAIFPDGTKGTVDGTGKYIVTATNPGTLKITKQSITVNVTGNNATFDYDGTEHSAVGYTATLANEDELPNGVKITLKDGVTAEAKRTEAGTTNMGLTAASFNIESANYDVTIGKVVDGYVTINKQTITVNVTGNNATFDYDGTEHSAVGYTATLANEDELPNGVKITLKDGVTAEAKRTEAGTTNMGLTAASFNIESANYDVTIGKVVDGYVTITPKAITVNVTGNHATAVYDGNEHVAEGYTATLADGNKLPNGVKITLKDNEKAEAKRTEVGTTNMDLTADSFNIESTNYNVTIGEVVDGYVTITPVTDKVTVTITEKSGTATYDGKEHIVSGYESMTADNPLYDEDSVEENPTVMWEAKGTDVGEYPVGIVAGDFKNTNANFTNVEFVVVDGALEITPAPVTLQAPIASKTYDGEPLKAEDYGHSYVEGVNFADDFAAVILTGSQTLVGSSESQITEVVTKKDKNPKNYKFTFLPGTLTVTDGTGDDPVKPENVVTKTHTPKDMGYNLGEPVTFTISVKNIYNVPKTITLIEKANVTFSNGDNTIEFKDVPAGKTVKTEATYTITSADILAGVFHNTVTAEFTDGRSWTAEDTVITAELNTTLNVTKTSNVPDGQKAALGQKITYTIKVQNAGNVPYTNVKVEDPLTGLTETIETLPVGETKTFTTEYVVTEADVLKGSVLNTATATGDKIKDPKSDEPKEPNGGDEVETPTFAPITIKPKDVTAIYNGAAITGKDVEITSGKLLEGHKLSAAVIGSGVNAGSYELTLDPEKIKIVDANNKDVSEMYARTILPGKLIINKRSVLITSQSATKTYDGSALTRPAVTITGDGFVPGELAKAEATGSITKVGSTPNAIQYTTTGAFNAANYSIALSVGTLTVTEKPKPEPRRTFNLTINYVYQNGKRAAASYNRGGLKNGETFDITSPVIAGYTASETVVSGTIYNRDIKVTVIYTADGVNLDDYGVPLGLGNITMNVGDCFE